MKNNIIAFLAIIHLFSLAGTVEEEVILYEKAYVKRLMLKKLHNLRDDGARKQYLTASQAERFDEFAQYLIEKHYEAPLEQRAELMSLAKRVIFLKGECNKQSAKLIVIKKQIDPILEQCRKTSDCSIFEKEYEQLQSTVNSLGLDNEIKLIESHQIYTNWRDQNKYHRNSFDQ